MAKNLILAPDGGGREISLPVPAGTKSGELVKSGARVGNAMTDRADSTLNAQGIPTNWGGGNPDGRASVWTTGVFEYSCADAVATEGTEVFLTGTSDVHTTTVTTTATGNTYVGKTTAVLRNGQAIGGTKTAGAGPIYVDLNAPRNA